MSSPQANFFGIFTLFGKILGGCPHFLGGCQLFLGGVHPNRRVLVRDQLVDIEIPCMRDVNAKLGVVLGTLSHS